MVIVKNKIKEIISAWDIFWFNNKNVYSLALFRVIFGLILLVMYAHRHLQVSFYYFESGFLPRELINSVLPEFYRPTFMWFPASDIGAVLLHSSYLAGLLIMVLGIFGRWFQFILLGMHLMFIYRNPTVIYGADIVSSFWLFYLCLADTRRHFSVLNFFKNAPPRPRPIGDLFNSVAIRLFQIQLCVIYGYTGMEKLKGAPWWEGTATWNAMANSQMALMDFSFILNYPLFIILGTYFTLLLEIYFPALIWPKKLRPWVLLGGVAFHFMIAVTMGLVFFSLIMVTAYLMFIPGERLHAVLTRGNPKASSV